jgi:hypothetical protein
MRQTRINAASRCHRRLFHITQASFGYSIRDQGAGGSNPLSPTKYIIINSLSLVLTSKMRVSGTKLLQHPVSCFSNL